MGSRSTLLLLLVVVAIVVVVAVARWRRESALGTSGAREPATALMHTGRRARALITAVQPTGMVVNDINLQCIVHFRLEPLGGGEPFDVHKKVLVSKTAMPQVGELWPSWFDPADPLQFVVGQPTAITPEQVGMFREFGIPHPLDR